jgi:sortase A
MRSTKLVIVRRLFLGIGMAALAYVGCTIAYGEVYQRYQSWKFDREVAITPAIAASTKEEAIDLGEGDVIGRLEIPRVGIAVMVLQGTEEISLAAGAGHVSGTPLPGADGNVAVAAHRDTFFRGLKDIRRGDSIRFSTRSQTYEYTVESMETVDPEDTRVIESRERKELTLITCYPFYYVGSAPKRFIVHAVPVEKSR